MSKELRQWASRQAIKSRSAKAVLRAIVWLAGNRGAVSVSHQTLVKRTGYCRDTVIEAIKTLRSLGLIDVAAQRGARGRQAANLYTPRPDINITSRVGKPTHPRVGNQPEIQSRKIRPLYTEVVIIQGKNEPREPNTVGVSNRGWDGGWPPPHLRENRWLACDDDPVIDTDWTSWESHDHSTLGCLTTDLYPHDCEVPQ